MDLGVEGRIGLVTGASAGIGRGIATVLAREGMQLVTVSRRLELLESLADEIEVSGGRRPLSIAEDLTDEGSIRRIHDQVLDTYGHLDVLVNNAGRSTSSYRGTLSQPAEWGELDVSEENWRAAFAINFDYIRRLTHSFLPGMMERGWGRIVLIGALPEPPRMTLGGAAKAALRVWMKGLSREVAEKGVTINAIPIGRIMSEQLLASAYRTDEEREELLSLIPMRRIGLPEEVGDAVAFLCSERSSYITGQGLALDGGMSMFAFY